MNVQVPTSVLKVAREAAGLSQTDLARLLSVSASIVSRLESSETADGKMADRYLRAIDSDLSKEVMDFYGKNWKNTERPSFLHPAGSSLRAAEEALQSLDRFEDSSHFDEILRDLLSKLRNRILSETDFVRQMEHGLAFIGDIGVGKTTALSFVMNLIMPDRVGKPRSVFPTGSGRTTVCEVAIKIAPAYGIAVESFSEEEVRRLVSDLVSGLKTGKTGLPSELARVIRSVSDLREVTIRSDDGKPKIVDRMRELIDTHDDLDRVVAEVMSRMKLETRTETQMILSEDTEGSIDWLASNISKINFGQHPGFSVPQRITVLLPLKALRDTPYLLSVIDTKGVEGTTQRRDLKAQIDDPRTVTVLCSKFSDAPGNTPISIVREIIDSGSNALDFDRICLLVLAREEEATKIVDGSGANPASAEEGYLIREVQIDQQFATEGLPTLPINFYNVGSDKPVDIWNWLMSRIEKLRGKQIARIERLVNAAHDLVSNSDVAKTRQARGAIEETMNAVVERFRDLPSVVRPAHQNLVVEAKKTHQSSIAASVNRRGDWTNFQATHILGMGVRIDANLRTRESFIRVDEQIEGLKGKFFHLLDVHQFLESLQDDISEWKQEFLDKAALMGRTSYAPLLAGAGGLWETCSHLYGAGSGYRVNIADALQNYFENDAGALATAAKVESALDEIWKDMVIKRLGDVVSFEEAESAL